jgi:hypothetical protein
MMGFGRKEAVSGKKIWGITNICYFGNAPEIIHCR